MVIFKRSNEKMEGQSCLISSGSLIEMNGQGYYGNCKLLNANWDLVSMLEIFKSFFQNWAKRNLNGKASNWKMTLVICFDMKLAAAAISPSPRFWIFRPFKSILGQEMNPLNNCRRWLRKISSYLTYFQCSERQMNRPISRDSD